MSIETRVARSWPGDDKFFGIIVGLG